MNKLSLVISSIGIFALVVSWTQWFFRFPDTSQLILGTGIGVCFLAFGYIYWWMKNKDIELVKLNKRLDDTIKFYTKSEFE